MFKLPANDEFLTEIETAELLTFSVAKLRGYRRRREIGCISIVRHVLYTGEHIRTFVHSKHRPACTRITELRVAYRKVANRGYLRRRRGFLTAGAYPAWADRAAIYAVYSKAASLSLETGIPHEVDHVIPLAGKNVCGLHVHTNLRAIPSAANRSKGSRFT